MAAQAKWAQETEKAREVTRAEQAKAVAELEAQKQLEVAKLHAQAAKEYEKEQIARANADATYKREVMQADGALAEKLQAWVQVNSNYALAMQNHPHSWVPSVVMGSMSEAGNPAMDMMSMIAAKTAKDLALDAGFKR
jgi:regulator of protease activity HflC (stomatin/prohibitin superfamily)